MPEHFRLMRRLTVRVLRSIATGSTITAQRSYVIPRYQPRGLRAWHDPYVVQYKRCTTWEGIGISSYLLINFWYTRLQANKSAIKALTVNRVGDTFLSVGFFAMLWVFGNVDYATVFSLAPYTNEYALTVIGLLFLLAGMGKSAQLGLHTWLPDAMEGPTPVSALIHAANYMWPPSSLMI